MMGDNTRLTLLEVPLLEALWLGKPFVVGEFIGELALAGKFLRLWLFDTGLTQQEGEERGADFRRLEPLLHQAIGELGLVGIFTRGKE